MPASFFVILPLKNVGFLTAQRIKSCPAFCPATSRKALSFYGIYRTTASRKQKSKSREKPYVSRLFAAFVIGPPGGIRTPGLWNRNPLRYPASPRAGICCSCTQEQPLLYTENRKKASGFPDFFVPAGIFRKTAKTYLAFYRENSSTEPKTGHLASAWALIRLSRENSSRSFSSRESVICFEVAVRRGMMMLRRALARFWVLPTAAARR